MEPDPGSGDVSVLRCGDCGDTFPTDDTAGAKCPSCGSDDLNLATEPLL